jgi:hypothetical protein
MQKGNGFQNILESAKTSAGLNGFQAKVNQLLERRESCADDGHSIEYTQEEFDKLTNDKIIVCTTCECYLPKNIFLESIGFEEESLNFSN